MTELIIVDPPSPSLSQKEEDRTWLAVEYLLRRTSSRSVLAV